MKKRAFELLKRYLAVVAIGIAYAIFLSITGIGIPCIIRLITGFRCPGCGITHMCMELLKGNVGDAYAYNRGVFLILPVILILWVRYVVQSIKVGRSKPAKLDHILTIGCIIILILWGIIRNLPEYEYLNEVKQKTSVTSERVISNRGFFVHLIKLQKKRLLYM